MTDPVLFADAVDVACTHLAALLDVQVVRKIPARRPASFVRIRRAGGPRDSIVVDGAQLLVESYAPTETEAARLAQLARQGMHAARGAVIDGVTVYAVEEMSGPGDLYDPVTESPRYSQTFKFPTRGA